jgi:hypothetical protein
MPAPRGGKFLEDVERKRSGSRDWEFEDDVAVAVVNGISLSI